VDAEAPATPLRQLAGIAAWAGAGAAFSHGTAALLHELEGPALGLPELSVPTHRRLQHPDVHTHQLDLPLEDITWLHGLPVTTVRRTLLDLAAVTDYRTLATAFHSAWRSSKVTPAELGLFLRKRRARGRTGVGFASELIEELRDFRRPLESAAEVSFWCLVKDAGLGLPQAQRWVAVDRHRRRRVDFLWPERRLVVEIDGYLAHGATQRAYDDTQARALELRAAGFTVLAFAPNHVRELGQTILAALRLALAPDRRRLPGDASSSEGSRGAPRPPLGAF
jgi:very-short-patch-repair endonuclease